MKCYGRILFGFIFLENALDSLGYFPGTYYSMLLRYNTQGRPRKQARIVDSPKRLWAYLDPPSALGSMPLYAVDNFKSRNSDSNRGKRFPQARINDVTAQRFSSSAEITESRAVRNKKKPQKLVYDFYKHGELNYRHGGTKNNKHNSNENKNRKNWNNKGSRTNSKQEKYKKELQSAENAHENTKNKQQISKNEDKFYKNEHKIHENEQAQRQNLQSSFKSEHKNKHNAGNYTNGGAILNEESEIIADTGIINSDLQAENKGKTTKNSADSDTKIKYIGKNIDKNYNKFNKNGVINDRNNKFNQNEVVNYKNISTFNETDKNPNRKINETKQFSHKLHLNSHEPDHDHDLDKNQNNQDNQSNSNQNNILDYLDFFNRITKNYQNLPRHSNNREKINNKDKLDENNHKNVNNNKDKLDKIENLSNNMTDLDNTKIDNNNNKSDIHNKLMSDNNNIKIKNNKTEKSNNRKKLNRGWSKADKWSKIDDNKLDNEEKRKHRVIKSAYGVTQNMQRDDVPGTCGGNLTFSLTDWAIGSKKGLKKESNRGRFSRQTIQSIGYPEFYETTSTCVWNIKINEGCKMGMLTPKFFDGYLSETKDHACEDSLIFAFEDGTNHRYCGDLEGTTNPYKWTKNSPKSLQIIFETKNKNNSTRVINRDKSMGFKFSISAYCWVYSASYLTKIKEQYSKNKQNAKKQKQRDSTLVKRIGEIFKQSKLNNKHIIKNNRKADYQNNYSFNNYKTYGQQRPNQKLENLGKQNYSFEEREKWLKTEQNSNENSQESQKFGAISELGSNEQLETRIEPLLNRKNLLRGNSGPKKSQKRIMSGEEISGSDELLIKPILRHMLRTNGLTSGLEFIKPTISKPISGIEFLRPTINEPITSVHSSLRPKNRPIKISTTLASTNRPSSLHLFGLNQNSPTADHHSYLLDLFSNPNSPDNIYETKKNLIRLKINPDSKEKHGSLRKRTSIEDLGKITVKTVPKAHRRWSNVGSILSTPLRSQIVRIKNYNSLRNKRRDHINFPARREYILNK